MATADPKKAKAPAHASGDSAGQQVQLRGPGYIREVIAELKPPKTKWPTPPEAWRLTVVVMAVILAVAVYIGALDTVLSSIVNKLNLIK